MRRISLTCRRVSMTPLPRATDDYDEAAHYVKLRFAEGEIDFIVATTLTTPGFVEQWRGQKGSRVARDS